MSPIGPKERRGGKEEGKEEGGRRRGSKYGRKNKAEIAGAKSDW